MILTFATKRNTNGNRRYLTIDTTKKEYTTEDRWTHRSDLIEVTRAEYNAIIEQADADGFQLHFTL